MIGFNLLVSTQANFEQDAGTELWFLINSYFDTEVSTRYFKYPGLILGRTMNDPRIVTRTFREENLQPRFIQKIVPIDRFVETDFSVIPTIVKNFVEDTFQQGDDFKIVLRKRRVRFDSSEVIEKVAREIPASYSVNLGNPKKRILLEVFHNYTGIAILQDGDGFKPRKPR